MLTTMVITITVDDADDDDECHTTDNDDDYDEVVPVSDGRITFTMATTMLFIIGMMMATSSVMQITMYYG